MTFLLYFIDIHCIYMSQVILSPDTYYWEQRKLSDVADKVTEKNIELTVQETFTNSAEFGVISQRDFFDHDISNADNIGSYYVVRDEDFVYNPRISATAPVGPVNRNRLGRNGVMSPLYTVFRTHDIDTTYLEWFFKSSYWHPFMFFNGDSGARSDRFSIKDAVFFEMPIPMPRIEEQSQIGAYMDKLDNLITLHQCKHYRLKLGCHNRESCPFSPYNTATWEQRKVGEVSKRVIVGLATSVTPYYREEGVPILRNLNIKENYLDDSDILFLDKSYAESQISKQIHTGDVLTVHTGYIGTSCIVPAKYDKCLTFTTLITTTDSTVLEGEFLAQYLNSEIGMSAVQAVTTQGGRQNLNTNDFVKVEIRYPSLAEQRKICAVLRNIDNLITLHQCKHYRLRSGDLSSQFDPFLPNNTATWEQRKVGDYYEFKNGLNKGKEFFGSGTPIVNFTDVFHNRGIETAKLKGRVTLEPSEIKNYEVKKGDLFFTRTSETIEEIGYPSVMLDEPENTVFSGFVLRGRCFLDQDPLDDLFKKYVFFTESFRNEMLKKSSMTTRALTSGTSIKEMVFFHPSSKVEQRKIGELLSQIDNSITLHQCKH